MGLFKAMKKQLQSSTKKDEKYLERKRNKKLQKEINLIVQHQTLHMITIESSTNTSALKRSTRTIRKHKTTQKAATDKVPLLEPRSDMIYYV